MNTKRKFRYTLLAIYEFIRVLFFLTTRPESQIVILPASWFVAAPLLFLPVLLGYTAQPATSERFFYLVSKASQLAGAVVYCIKDYPYAIYGVFNGWSSLLTLFTIVLFSLIDAILFVILLIPHKGKVEDADYSSSQR